MTERTLRGGLCSFTSFQTFRLQTTGRRCGGGESYPVIERVLLSSCFNVVVCVYRIWVRLVRRESSDCSKAAGVHGETKVRS